MLSFSSQILSFAIMFTKLLSFSIYSIDSMNLDLVGYEHCVLNLVNSDLGRSRGSQAWLQDISASNIKNPRTVTALPEYQSPLHNVYLTSPNATLVEACSVNIWIQVEAQFQRQIKDIFGSRLYDPLNTLVFIFSGRLVNTLNSINPDALPIYSAVFVLEVSEPNKQDVDVTRVHSLCPACSQKYQHTIIDIRHNNNLKAMRQFADQIKTRSIEHILGILVTSEEPRSDPCYKCEFQYRKNGRYESNYNECNSFSMFMQSIATQLNWTVLDIPSRQAYQNELYFKGFQRHIKAISMFYPMGWKIVGEPHAPDKLISHQYVTLQRTILLYCTHESEREGFTFLFWMLPLDLWSWILLSITMIALTIKLRGNWLEIISILMRQSSHLLRKQKVLIIFIFASIIFTYGYEGIVSSLLTVPPPYKTLKTLQNLKDAGYKIILPSSFSSELGHWEAQHPNLSTGLITDFQSDNNYFRTLALCNVTTPMDLDMSTSMAMQVKSFLPRTGMCNVASDTAFAIRPIFTYIGEGQATVSFIGRRMFQAGIFALYYTYDLFTTTYLEKRKIEVFEYNEAKKEASFSITDWKMLSIFVTWGSLTGLTVMVFMVEIVVKVIFIDILLGKRDKVFVLSFQESKFIRQMRNT